MQTITSYLKELFISELYCVDNSFINCCVMMECVENGSDE